MIGDDKPIRNRYGSDEAYYKKLEEFHKQHRPASYIEVDSDFNCPVKAVYYFEPYQVFIEHEALKLKIREAMQNQPIPNSTAKE